MYKQVIIVRKDLKLGTGKIASQAAHASLGAYLKTDRKIASLWASEGSKKVVLKVNSIGELRSIQSAVKKENMQHFIVRDAGLTQTESGTVTALGIGPVEEKKIDRITARLKLL